MVRTTSITMPSMVGCGLYAPQRMKSSTLFLRHAFERYNCANDFAIKAFEYGNAFGNVG